MSQSLTAQALLQLVRRYYPAGIHGGDPRYEASEEFKRLTALRRAAVEDARAWDAFLQRVETEMPDCVVWDYPNIRYDPAYCLRLGLPGYPDGGPEHKEVVLMVCILAPVHLLYADHSKHVGDITETITYPPPFPTEFQPFAEKLEALAIETFGTTRLPEEVLSTPVPDIHVGLIGFGKVTLADCLFSDHRW
ncbi:hypothetical protein HPC49_10010 [Pyxidicoccus fallax]|uniref:Uncharacterized protein n=1 Tax=Pyxidicoccus fallax TaxID=394095 RepID=A0A848LK35_9BACT|nr:hypothetical protein [Pyxidicoccus fallax]NMO18070.1 hypothetical protein [Pyxidicoccus fallax]NPC78576.1 hypothetical protein [Pyxidicoccus fallax]